VPRTTIMFTCRLGETKVKGGAHVPARGFVYIPVSMLACCDLFALWTKDSRQATYTYQRHAIVV